MATITTTQIRDEMIDCFFKEHKEHIKDRLGDYDDADIKRKVIEMIKRAFEDEQENYHNPTKEGLQKVLLHLVDHAQRAQRDIKVIEQNRTRFEEMLAKLD